MSLQSKRAKILKQKKEQAVLALKKVYKELKVLEVLSYRGR